MPILITGRKGRVIASGFTAADMARQWGVSRQGAGWRLSRPGAPEPVATITITDAGGRAVKVQALWRQEDFDTGGNTDGKRST